MSHKAIGERLRRAHSPEARMQTALAWGAEWHDEQAALLRKLRNALAHGDASEADFYLCQLEAVNDKRHSALPRVLQVVADGGADDRD